MATTSSELGGLFADGKGHEIAQGYGMFLWAAVVLYVAVAWSLLARRKSAAGVRQTGPGHGPHAASRQALADRFVAT